MNLQETYIQIDVKKAAFERRANNCDTFKEIPNMWPKFYKTYEFREVQQLVGRPENAKTHFSKQDAGPQKRCKSTSM